MPYSVLIDCDPGVDDMVALLLASVSEQVKILGVTTVSGNVGVDQTTANALSVLALAGDDRVPVARGAERALIKSARGGADGVHGSGGLGGARIPQPVAVPDGRHAVDLMAGTVEGSVDPVTLIATGPLTNVALFFARYPEVASRLDRLIIMGGSIGPGNVNDVAEFNMWFDPEAAYRVLTDSGLSSPFPISIIGLDVASQVFLGPDDIATLRESGHKGSLIADALSGQYLEKFEKIFGRSVVPVYDALTVVELLSPGCITYETANVEVDTTFGGARGKTSFTFVDAGENAYAHRVGVRARAGEAKDLIMDQLTRLR